MLKNLLIAICVVFIFAACQSDTKTAENETKTENSESATPANEFFGDKISPEEALSFNQLLTEMDKLDSIETKVTGTVESVCNKKGCWVNIVSEDGREMFVKFKDYGFFLPKDCEGRQVVMEGKAFRETTSVDELRHMAEDGGASKEEIEKITEPKEELKFMASGVVLLAENN